MTRSICSFDVAADLDAGGRGDVGSGGSGRVGEIRIIWHSSAQSSIQSKESPRDEQLSVFNSFHLLHHSRRIPRRSNRSPFDLVTIHGCVLHDIRGMYLIVDSVINIGIT